MRTRFSIAQLANSDIQESNQILRRCVHCGFCLATCPTHVLLGDELDSPRGRIYLIKEMLEADKPPSPETVKHLDRCLGCASCMTTCPSDVNYVRLLEHGRVHVARTHSRTMADRISRWFFANLLARPSAFRVAVRVAAWFRPLSSWLPRRMQAGGRTRAAPATADLVVGPPSYSSSAWQGTGARCPIDRLRATGAGAKH